MKLSTKRTGKIDCKFHTSAGVNGDITFWQGDNGGYVGELEKDGEIVSAITANTPKEISEWIRLMKKRTTE